MLCLLATEVTNETLSSAETVITLHVENPEIILVEDSMSAHTNALVLDVSPTISYFHQFLQTTNKWRNYMHIQSDAESGL